MYGPYEIIYSKIQERFPFCLFRTKHAEASSLYYVTYKMSSSFFCTQTVLDAYDKFRECSPFFPVCFLQCDV